MAHRRYRSPLREEHAAATRDRLLTSAHALLRTVRPVDLSYNQLAAEAEVSVRTVYRHFPTSDDLFRALSDRLLGQLLGPGVGPRDPLDLRGGKALLARQFALMEADPALFRVFFAVPTRSRTGGNEPVERMFSPHVAHLGPRERAMVLAMIDLVASPYAWDVLHANWGLPAGDATQASLFAIRAVLDLALTSPERLAPGADPFPLPEDP